MFNILLVITAWFVLVGRFGGSISLQLTSTITGFAISNEYVFVSTSTGTVYNVSMSSLTAERSYQLGANIGDIVLDHEGQNVLLCFLNSTCVKISHNETVASLSTPLSPSLYTSLSVLYTNGALYVGSWSTELETMFFRKISDSLDVEKLYWKSPSSNYSPRFVSSFSANGFVYFVVQDRKYVRILRFCEENELKALYEIHLKSLPVTSSSLLVTGQLVTVGTVPIVIIGLSFDESYSGVYGIKLSDINTKAAASYNTCYQGVKPIALPWETPSDHKKCDQFGPHTYVKVCNFNYQSSRISAIHATVDSEVQTMFEMNGRLTASQAIEYKSRLFYYAALTNTTGSVINKYLLMADKNGTVTSAQLLRTWSVNDSVTNINWNLNYEKIIATTTTTVFTVPLDDCSIHTSCSQCINSTNLLCGWCVIGNHCSLQERCSYSNISGHWTNNLCTTVHVNTTRIALSTTTEIVITSNPPLPLLPSNVSYICLLENKQENISISVQLKENYTRCFVPSSLLSFENQSVVLNIALTSPLSQIPFAIADNDLTIVDCSKSDSCSQCLTDWIDTCGWCVEDMTCVAGPLCGNSSVVYLSSNEQVNQVCPAIFTTVPNHLPLLMYSNNVSIIGSNLPSTVNGQYICHINHSDTVYQSTAVYVNSTNIRCPFSSFHGFNNTEETFNIKVHWSVQSSTHVYELELYDNSMYCRNGVFVSFYNCSSLSSSCTLCLERSSLAAINCVWCNNKCSPSEECTANYSVIQTSDCPVLIIDSILPSSGPVNGGTIISISSDQLPIHFNDIISVYIGSTQCKLIITSFISSHQVSCITGMSPSSGTHSVVLVVNRDGYNVSANSSSVTFSYQIPVVTSVIPTWGPLAGGTEIEIFGSFLNIGDITRTRVLVAGVDCINKVIKQSVIKCTTQSSSQLTVTNIQVIFDDSTTVISPNVSYQYQPDPICTGLTPTTIIPAGGITLSFVGNYMRSVYRPQFIINYNNMTYTTICSPVNDTHIHCISPALSPVTFKEQTSIPVDNQLKLDNVDCSSFHLYLKPNPNFTSLLSKPSQVTIYGSNINSVANNEIMVTVGDRPCIIQEITDQSVVCIPPTVLRIEQKYSVNVTVIIGNGTLIYNIGQIQYVPQIRSGSSSLILAVAIASVTFVMAIVMLVAAAVAVKYWKIKHPPLKNLTKLNVVRSSTRSSHSNIKPLETSLQQSNDYCDIITDNIYETISDNVNNTVYQNTIPQDVREYTGYDLLNRRIPTQPKPTVPASLPIYHNAMPSTLRPVSDVVINYPKDDDNTKIVGNISASSPDLSNTSWPNSTNNLLSESEPEDTDGNQATAPKSTIDIPEYAKVIKKLTPIQEDKAYSKSTEKRPQLLKLHVPQEEYVSMHSATSKSTASTPHELPENYIQMKPSLTASTPQQESLAMESSYVVMRSASVSSDSAPTVHSSSNKRMRLPSKVSVEGSQVSEDVFLSSCENYIDMQSTTF